MKYDIWQDKEIVAVVDGDSADDYTVEVLNSNHEHDVRLAVELALQHPAMVMYGGELPRGAGRWDGAKTYEPGDDGFFDAVMTGGALVKYGYIGVGQDEQA